jgi:hypothetical protein
VGNKVNIQHRNNSHYPIEIKVKAVSLWLAYGNIGHVASILGVSRGLVAMWRATDWWKELEAEVKQEAKISGHHKIGTVINKSLDVMADRLENGDVVLNNKTGELVRKPVGLRDATSAANALMQRAAIIEKLTQNEQTVDATISIKDQLAGLAKEFAKFTGRRKEQAEDVPYVETVGKPDDQAEELNDAVYEKRETGLPEGSGEIHVQTGSEKETC